MHPGAPASSPDAALSSANSCVERNHGLTIVERDWHVLCGQYLRPLLRLQIWGVPRSTVAFATTATAATDCLPTTRPALFTVLLLISSLVFALATPIPCTPTFPSARAGRNKVGAGLTLPD